MNAFASDRRTMGMHGVSRRAALRGLGGAGLAALAAGLPTSASADSGDRIARALFSRIAEDNDPAAIIEAYVAAVNTGDLEGILALYDDGAFHVALPTPDGSAGVCLGKDHFRIWYEQSVANGDRIEVAQDSLVVDGNQATFAARLSSEPWRELGLEALDAYSEIVLIGGRIMTHVVLLTPESVRQLAAARGTAAT